MSPRQHQGLRLLSSLFQCQYALSLLRNESEHTLFQDAVLADVLAFKPSNQVLGTRLFDMIDNTCIALLGGLVG